MNTSASETQTASEDQIRKLGRRYMNGYTTANLIDIITSLVKTFGLLLAVVMYFIGSALFAQLGLVPGATFVLNIVACGLGFSIIYVVGTILTGLAELLQASLDTAVHTSPFLTPQLKINAMCLPKK